MIVPGAPGVGSPQALHLTAVQMRQGVGLQADGVDVAVQVRGRLRRGFGAAATAELGVRVTAERAAPSQHLRRFFRRKLVLAILIRCRRVEAR